MPLPRYNATTPQYNKLHYNHSAETAALLKYLEADTAHGTRSVMQIVDPQGVSFERLIQHSCNVYSEQSDNPVNVCWMQFFQTPKFHELANRIRQCIHEIRIGLDGQVGAGCDRTILPGSIPLTSAVFYKDFIQPGLAQISKRTLIFVLDLTLVETLHPHRIDAAIDLLECMIRTPVNSNLKILLAVREPLRKLWEPESVSIDPVPEDIVEYFQRIVPDTNRERPESSIPEGDLDVEIAAGHILTPLRFLNSGAEREVVAFLAKKWTNSDENVFWPLVQQHLIKWLVHKGVSLERSGLDALRNVDVSQGCAHMANNCKVLSFQPPEFLLESRSGFDALRRLEASQEFMIDALSAMLEGWRFNDKQKWDFILNRFTDVHAVADYAAQVALSRYKIVLSYLTQLIISREEFDDPRLFQSLELLTGHYAEAMVSQIDCTAKDEHEAARSYYNLYYLMDRTSTRRPRLFATSSPQVLEGNRRSHARYAVRYQGKSLPEQTDQALRHTFHLAWYHFDTGDPGKAGEMLLDLAHRCSRAASYQGRSIPGAISTFTLYALDCAGFAFSMNPGLLRTPQGLELGRKIISRYGGFQDLQELHDYLALPTPAGRPYIPGMTAPSQWRILIHFSHYDWVAALQIADSATFDLGLCPHLSPTENGSDFLSSLSKQALAHVVLGSPDSPGAVGEFISNIDKDLASVYQARLGDDFILPIATVYREQPIIVLMGSGIRCIADAWAVAVEDTDRFPMLQIKGGQSMPIDIFATVLGSVLKKSSERMADMLMDRLARHIRKRLKSTGESGGDEPIENAVKMIRGAASGKDTGDPLIQDKLADMLSRPQRREFARIAQPSGMMELLQDRLNEIRTAGADVEPQDFEDVFNILIIIVDYILETKGLRNSAVKELGAYRTGFSKKQKEFNVLSLELRAGEDVTERMAKLETTTRTMVGNFTETIATLM